MAHVNPHRSYDNSRRAAAAAANRGVVLDAVVRVLARGVAELSMPAVAKEAGISLRTVYRLFPTKRHLFKELDKYLDRRIGYSLDPPARDLSEMGRSIRTYFKSLEAMDEHLRVARTTTVAMSVRQSAGLPAKLAALRPIVKETDLAREDQRRLYRVAATLWSQFTFERMKDDLGLNAKEAADAVVWAIIRLAEK